MPTEQQKQHDRDLENPSFNKGVVMNAQRVMAIVDSWDEEWRQVAYDYGHDLVIAFRECGVRQPKRVRHLIDLVRGETLAGVRTAVRQIPKGRPTTASLVDDDEKYIAVQPTVISEAFKKAQKEKQGA